jgi:hypothetical protein
VNAVSGRGLAAAACRAGAAFKRHMCGLGSGGRVERRLARRR